MNKPSSFRAPWRAPLREVNDTPAPWPYRALVRLARLFIGSVSIRRWIGQENIPRRGGVLIVANHTSNYDALALGEFLIWSGRWPRFLGKADIWRVPILGWLARQCRQIPVYRNTEQAADSLIHAAAALREGDAVVIFPEGTITRDPDGWPMTGRRGAARLALSTAVPVVPVALMGCPAVLGGTRLRWRGLFGRRSLVTVRAGAAIELRAFEGREPSKEILDQATQQIMDAITALYADLRGQRAPKGRWDMRINARR